MHTKPPDVATRSKGFCMTLAELLAGIDAEKSTAINALFESQREGFEGTLSKKSSEVSRLLGKTNKYKDLIRETFEVDPEDEKIGEKFSEIRSRLKSTETSATGLSKLEQEVKALKAINDASALEMAATRKSMALSKANAALNGKVHNHEDSAYRLVSEGKIRFSDTSKEVVYFDNDEEKDLNTGVELFVKSRPDIAKTQQKGGTGTGGGEKGKQRDEKRININDFHSLPAMERAAKMADGYEITD
jgi:hypothetical protein